MPSLQQVDPNDVLLLAVTEALLNTMREGDSKYGKHDWVHRPDVNDIEHVQAHIMAFASGDRSENHIEHVITRCGMMLARQELVKLGAKHEGVPFRPSGSAD